MSIQGLNEVTRKFKKSVEDLTIDYEIKAVDSIGESFNKICELVESLRGNEGTTHGQEIVEELIHERDSIIDNLAKYSNDFPKDIKKNTINYLAQIKQYAGGNRRLTLARVCILENIAQNAMDTLADDLAGELRTSMDCLADYLKAVEREQITKQFVNILEDICKDIESNQKEEVATSTLSKIFDYKEMLTLAEDNGYVYTRSNGDHMILKHSKSNKIVVIPAHDLGYGLMKNIQKQINKNKERTA